MNFGLVAEKLTDAKYFEFLNKMSEDGLYNVMAFINQLRPFPVAPEFAIMPQKEIFQVDGPLLAIDLSSAKLIQGRFRLCKNFFYLNQVEWHKLDHLSYNNIVNVFLDDDLSIIVNTPKEGSIVQNVWGRKAIVVGELNVESVRNIIG